MNSLNFTFNNGKEGLALFAVDLILFDKSHVVFSVEAISHFQELPEYRQFMSMVKSYDDVLAWVNPDADPVLVSDANISEHGAGHLKDGCCYVTLTLGDL